MARRPIRKRLSAAQIKAAYKATFGSESGRIVLDDLLRSFVNRTSYVPGDPYGTHVREGRREVVLRIQFMLGTPINADDIIDTDEEA